MATVKRPRTKKATEVKETKETPVKTKASVFRQAAAVNTRPVDQAVLHEAVRVRAYQLFLERGCQHGADFEDWLRAEQEVLRSLPAVA